MDTIECMNREQRSRLYFAHAPNDLNLHILRMFKCIFSLGAAHLIVAAIACIALTNEVIPPTARLSVSIQAYVKSVSLN